MSQPATFLKDAPSHAGCIGNLSQMAAIARASEAMRGLAPARLAALRAGPALRAGGLAGLLAAPRLGADALGRMGLFAMTASLAQEIARLFPLPHGLRVDPLAHLRGRIAALRGAVSAAPALGHAGLPGLELLAAARELSPLGIDVFHPAAGQALAAYLGRLRGDGTLQRLASPGAPRSIAALLNGYGSLAGGMEMLRGGPIAGGGFDLGPARLGALGSAVQASPFARLCSEDGRHLLPDPGELRHLSIGLSQLRAERELRQFLAKRGSVRGQSPGDLLGALERSGCCQVLREFGELRGASAGALRFSEVERNLAVIQRGLGVDARAPQSADALGAAAARASHSLDRLPRAMAAMAQSPHAPQASSLASLLIQAKEVGLALL